jgi:hypothetical protein
MEILKQIKKKTELDSLGSGQAPMNMDMNLWVQEQQRI